MIELKILLDSKISSLLKENNQDAQKYISVLKSNKNLREYWGIVNNLQEGKCPLESTTMFIQENINMAKGLDLKPIREVAAKFEAPEISEMDAAIDFLLFEEKTPHNIQKYIDAYACVQKHLVGNHERQQKMEMLGESLKALNENELSKKYMEAENKEVFFENLKRESMEMLAESIKVESDPETKLLMFESKEKLESMQLNDDQFVSQILEIRSLLD